MPDSLALVTIGGLLLVGLAMDELGRRTRLPRVTLLVLFGVIAGPSGFDLLPAGVRDWFPLVTVMALVMVAFLLGGKLTRKIVAQNGFHIMGVSLGAVIVTAGLVGVGFWIIGLDPILCVVMAGISTATDPAATQDVVRRSGEKGPFAQTLLGVVAIDDAWGLVVFGLLLACGHALLGQDSSAIIALVGTELGGALLVGAAVGFPAAYLTGRLRAGEPTQTEALGVVFLCGGLALLIGASYLLAAMTAGFIVANFARHHKRALHEIEHIEWPFMVLFFVLAGASLNLAMLQTVGIFGAVYMVLRAVGRVAGGWLGACASGMRPEHGKWIGIALMPQAGVAMGMAMVAAGSFPQLSDEILSIAIGTTILFELIGPLCTQWALSNTRRTAGSKMSKE